MASTLPSFPALPAGGFELLLERSGALTYSFNASGVLLSANRALTDRLELGPADLKDLKSLVRACVADPRFRDTVLAVHDRAIAGEKLRDFEWVYTARTGDLRQLRWQFLSFGTGTSRVVVALGEDVTDRRKLENWVRLYGNLLEHVPEAVMLADNEGRILHWTGGAERLLGYSPRSALERPLSNMIAGDQPRNIVMSWVDRARQEGSFSATLALRKEKGDTLECTVQVARVMNERGEATSIAVIASPVTTPALPEANRAESPDAVRELDRAISTFVSVPAVVVSPDGKVRAWSRGAERLGGMTAVKAKGKCVLDEVMLVPELTWETLVAKLQSRPKHSQTVEVRRPNGSKARAELDAVALKAPDGSIDTVLLCLVDRAEADAIISESRRLKERALTSVFVEGVVRRILDGVAHFEPEHRLVLSRLADLRTLARMVANGAPIREFDQFTRRARLGDMERELDSVMESLGEGVSRLRVLGDDIAAFSTVEPQPPGPVRLSRELEAARDLLSHVFENRLQVDFVVDDLPAARASRGPLLRAFCLLLLAASESVGTDDGGRVQVEGKVQGGFLWLEVRDNGAGYSSEVQTRIHDIDFLAAQSGYAAFYLGLAREAMRAAGGSLELGSAIGTGARVRVSFPLADQPGPMRPIEAARPHLARRGKVILVEEDTLLRQALDRHLSESFDVFSTASLAGALGQIAEQAFDVAVVSLPRPESFGLKLLSRVAEASANIGRNCIVVVHPGVKQGTRERLVGLGAIVLVRPVDFTTIASICDRLVPGEVVEVSEDSLSALGEVGDDEVGEPVAEVLAALAEAVAEPAETADASPAGSAESPSAVSEGTQPGSTLDPTGAQSGGERAEPVRVAAGPQKLSRRTVGRTARIEAVVPEAEDEVVEAGDDES